MNLLKKIFGDGGITKSELKNAVYRHPFSGHLPWLAYEPESQLFYNIDDTVGYVWECVPLCFAGEKTYSILHGLLRSGLPEGSVIQFIMYADPDITPILESKGVSRQTNLTTKALKKYADFIKEGSRNGLDKNSGIPVRNFRLFVSVKIPKSSISQVDINDVKKATEETLHGVRLHPRILDAHALVDLTRRFFNDTPSELNNRHYSEEMPLNRQVLTADTGIDVVSGEELKVGTKYMRCITPKVLPREIDALTMNEVFGGIWGVPSDFEQITAPFLCTLNIVVRNIKGSLEKKMNATLAQQSLGSFVYKLERRKEEFRELSKEFDEKTYFQIMLSLWVWTGQREKTTREAFRVKRIWDAKGFFTQNDSYILPVMLISSLPFGLYNVKKNIDFTGRTFIVPDDVAPYFMPVQGDFTGSGSSLLYVGRKGQFSGIDIFSDHASNYNVFIAAGSGKGKSFLLNYVILNSYSEGGIIRVIDIGGSYRKMVNLCNARYLDLADRDMCLNPFTNLVSGDTQEIQYMLNSISAVVLQMCFHSSDAKNVTESEFALAKEAVKFAHQTAGHEADIDLVWEFLKNFKDFAPQLEICQEGKCMEDLEQMAGMMAFTLREFTSKGAYGKIFNGKSNFNIQDDEFVVLELETLKRVKELFKIITLIVLDETTREMYLSDRQRPRFVMIDEAFQFLGDSNIQREVIEEGYRRARKYRASFGVVLQSVLDLERFGSVGEVINSNSAFKFYLESNDFEKAQHKKLIDYNEFEMMQLKSVKSNLPKYSEVFLDSPDGRGVIRLLTDQYNYYVYTSNPRDISEIEKLIGQGKSYDEAIESLL